MSQDLREITEQIEARNTDGFGKFYMYAALLQVITVRKKTFEEALPKQTTLGTVISGAGAAAVNTVGKWVGVDRNLVSEDQSIQLELGEVSAGGTNRLFYSNVSKYKTNFEVKSPNFLIVIKNMIDAYFRRGQLSDLSFIVKKMNSHLKEYVNNASGSSCNSSLFRGITFKDSQNDVVRLLDDVTAVTKLAHDTVDSSAHALGVCIAAIVGLVVTISAGHLLIAAAIGLAGGISAYYFIAQAQKSFANIQVLTQAYMELSKSILLKHTDDVLPTPNYNAFIRSAILKPLAYTGVTVEEQLAPDQEYFDMVKKERTLLDRQCAEFSM
ncbi:MAG: hypothetical protein NXI01_05515 [Gammaproteobacteria bacterium]|nr:hypothetical protein [Gammaproteobacteria bacterium]